MPEQEWYISEEKLKIGLKHTERMRSGAQIYERVSLNGHAAFEAAMEKRGIVTVRDPKEFETGTAGKCYFDEESSTYYIAKRALDKNLQAQNGVELSMSRSAVPHVMVTQL